MLRTPGTRRVYTYSQALRWSYCFSRERLEAEWDMRQTPPQWYRCDGVDQYLTGEKHKDPPPSLNSLLIGTSSMSDQRYSK